VKDDEEIPMLSLFGEVKPVKGKKIARANARKSAYKQVSPGEVEALFAFWLETFSKKALLSDERRAILAWAILNYGMETCKMAVKGCAMSDWHMGRNPNNVRYDQIELIFRSSEKVEWFAEKYTSVSPGETGEPF
jgi:hypothetical protein